jgi:hypothetical protein
MSEKQRHKKKKPDKSNWKKWLVLIAGGLVLAIVAAIVIAVVWLIPAIVRFEVVRALSEYWDGKAELEEIHVSYFGPTYLKGLKLFDKDGQKWLDAEVVEIGFVNWPSRSPIVTEIEVNKLKFQISATGGKLALPLVHHSSRSTASNRKLNLQRLTIKEATITAIDAQGSKKVYDNLMLSATRRENFYDVLLNRISPETSELFVAKGRIDARTFKTEISFKMKHAVKRAETTMVFAALNASDLSAEGKLTADLTITGCLKEPAGLQPRGTVKLDEYVLFIKDKVLANNLNTVASFDGQSLNFDKFSAVMCNGRVSGAFYAKVEQKNFTEFRGRILAVNVNFPEFTSVLTGDAKKAARGTFTARYDFTGRPNDLKALNGEGLIVFYGADASVLPVIPQIFRFIGLSKYEPLKMSDVEAIFNTAGPVVTIKSGHIANSYAAIEFEPGGTVNLQTKRIDGYVVVAPLRQIAGAIENLPVINIFANLKDKLMRLHVKGHWSDPPPKLIKKEPIEDIRDATVGFIQDVVKTGGQFGQGMLDTLGTLFQKKQSKNK